MTASWDVFISHASEDKKAFVEPLANALKERGLRVWYDASTLKLGDSLRSSIEHGLANSRYGVVVLSPFFLSKNWTQQELNGLFAREMNGEKVILPVWHNITKNELLAKYPILADRLSALSMDGLQDVVDKIVEAVGSPNVIGEEDIAPATLTALRQKIAAGFDKKRMSDDLLRDSPNFFSLRFTEAFPGKRTAYISADATDSTKRILRLLKRPLVITSDVFSYTHHPIWWWRGYRNMHISCAKKGTDGVVFLDNHEILLDRIIAFPSESYKQQFVYIEASAMPPCGLYPYPDGLIKERADAGKIFREEFAVFRGQTVTRHEFDDGGAEIDGKLVRFHGKAELRTRYLTKYNFILAPQWSPINYNNCDGAMERLLDELLVGSKDHQDLQDFVFNLPMQ